MSENNTSKKTVVMTVTSGSIYLGLTKLRKLIYELQVSMEKVNKIIYGTPLIEASSNVIRFYVLAFTIKDEGRKTSMIEEVISHFAVLKIDLENCMNSNIFHFKTSGEKLDPKKVELIKLIGEIDGDITKWYNSVSRKR